MKKILIIAVCIVAIVTETFAVQMIDQSFFKICIKDDYSYAKSEWVTIDTDGDGFEEYYYFDENGFLVVNKVTPDGYKVNGKGQYVVDGVVQTKIKSDTGNSSLENNENGTNYIISKKQEETEKKEDVFVDYGHNTEGSENDPNTIQPKVKKAMDSIKFWCNEDGEMIIPYSKKQMRSLLRLAGYKDGTVERALSESNIDWSYHALCWAKHLRRMGYVEDYIKEYMREVDGFSSEEVQYAITNLENDFLTKRYIEPLDYVGISDEEKKIKLFSLGFSEEQVKQALVFLNYDK